MRRTCIFLTALAACSAWAQKPDRLSDTEIQGLQDTLFLSNLTIGDLSFERKPFREPYRARLIDLSLDKPLDAANHLMALHAAGGSLSLPDLLGRALQDALDTAPSAAPAVGLGPPPETLASLPQALQPPVRALLMATDRANRQIRAALAKLTPAERRSLIESLPQWAAEEPLVKFAFVRTKQLSQPKILELLGRIDLAAIWSAGKTYAAAIDAQIAPLRAARSQFKGQTRIVWNGIKCDIFDASNSVVTADDGMLTIDLGGDDLYRGRVGAGVGYASALIDLGGNDRYETPDLSVGAGLLGVGIARDLGGSDVYRTRSLSLGSGLAGVGAFVKQGGDDDYRSIALSQGFGQFGIGLMLDTGGDDRYSINLYGQGAARTRGLGWLIDRNGSDIYRAGGLSLNSPLFKDVYYSNAQGFGSGYREDTGGISGGTGLLTDLAGDDAYLGETYCQAASYWFSIGSLYDGGGNDSYSGYHYVQSSAMHMTSAYLFDLAGDDSYSVKFGASHAIGHDYGVAMLLDRAGNDLSAARESMPGIGNANGLGIFLDASGDDRYQGPPGSGNPARGSGSLGVFADLGGQDLYRTDLVDGSAAVRQTWGVAYDVEDPLRERSTIPAQTDEPKPGSVPSPGDAGLAKLYATATQWRVGTAQQEAEASIRQLIEIGMPAFEWMLANRLAGADRLQIRAFVSVATGIGAPARQALAPKIASENENEARVALTVAIDGSMAEAAPFIPKALQRPALQRLASRAAGVVGSKESVSDLMALAASKNLLLALDAMVALAAIKDEAAYGTAEALVTSPELPIRKAALNLMAAFPARALDSGRRLAQADDERTARLGLELLSAIGTPEALQELGQRLVDPRAGMRIQAMLGLNGRCPEEFRGALLALRTDPVPTVRALAAKVDPGR